MRTCPVCENECTANFCDACGFDFSADFEHFPTLQPVPADTLAISALRQQRASSNVPANCPCCGNILTASHCNYCGFDIAMGAPAQAVKQQALQHGLSVLDALTEFAITTYQYAWVPSRSRLERQSRQVIQLGNARSFFNQIHWAEESFAQVRDGNSTALDINISYLFKGEKKTLYCKIPTVRGNDFWHLGIQIDASLHVTFFLRSGENIVRSAPMPLELT